MTMNGRRPAISFKVWKTGAESLQRTLAGIMHKLSTAVPQSSTLTARPANGYPLSSWRLRHFVTKAYA